MTSEGSNLRNLARSWSDNKSIKPGVYNCLMTIADRIDAEMVELPNDKDGEPIHLNDKIYDLNWNEQTVLSLHLYEKAPMKDRTSPMWTVSLGFGGQMAPRYLTHKPKDSLERIAQELEDMSENFRMTDKESFSDGARRRALGVLLRLRVWSWYQ